MWRRYLPKQRRLDSSTVCLDSQDLFRTVLGDRSTAAGSTQQPTPFSTTVQGQAKAAQDPSRV